MGIKRFFTIAFLVLVILSMMSICAMTQEVKEIQFADGVYEGHNSMLDVSVTIEKGRIVDIEILEHRGGSEKHKEMILPLIDLMIEKQSTKVDVVTGATTSSDALKIAVEETLEKASLRLQKKELIEKYTTD